MSTKDSKTAENASGLDLGGNGTGALDMTSPDFKKAVAEAVAAEVAKHVHAINAAGAPPAAAASLGNDKSFIEGLTLSLAELANQGTGRIYVAPEVLASRAAARELMIDLILKARRELTPPAYRLTNKVELANQVIEPMWLNNRVATPTEIEWYGAPNDAMAPINMVAKAIKEAWINSIGGIKKVMPDDRLGMTAKGLVVRGGAIPSAAGDRGTRLMDETGELAIRGMGSPGNPSRQPILGTVHEPAALNVTPYPGQPRV